MTSCVRLSGELNHGSNPEHSIRWCHGGVVVWLLRGWISERIQQSIRHEGSRPSLRPIRAELNTRIEAIKHENELRQLRTSLFFDHQRNAFAGLLRRLLPSNRAWIDKEFVREEWLSGPVPYDAYKELQAAYYGHQLFLDAACLAAMELVFECSATPFHTTMVPVHRRSHVTAKPLMGRPVLAAPSRRDCSRAESESLQAIVPRRKSPCLGRSDSLTSTISRSWASPPRAHWPLDIGINLSMPSERQRTTSAIFSFIYHAFEITYAARVVSGQKRHSRPLGISRCLSREIASKRATQEAQPRVALYRLPLARQAASEPTRTLYGKRDYGYSLGGDRIRRSLEPIRR